MWRFEVSGVRREAWDFRGEAEGGWRTAWCVRGEFRCVRCETWNVGCEVWVASNEKWGWGMWDGMCDVWSLWSGVRNQNSEIKNLRPILGPPCSLPDRPLGLRAANTNTAPKKYRCGIKKTRCNSLKSRELQPSESTNENLNMQYKSN